MWKKKVSILQFLYLLEETPDPKYNGLGAAAMLKMAIDPDLIVFTSDAYWTDKEHHGSSLSEEFEKGNKSVKEALICVSIDKAEKITLITIPYYAEDNIIIWDEATVMENPEGFIPESLKKIMNKPLIINHPLLQAIELDEDKKIYHAARAAIHFLRDKGYNVSDLI
jgi:hypothetical protein